ncbi:hypothetical protein IEQ34_019391 [Dendrobium chrysotoxum]|uniref:Uncharacterized protein n=1 Tax=Dendrobium chrysotoxum TaxID=161865 RepID=A0AAV7G8N1_DENCH|nr:hypothetical protein IEQ34_019391 [Dendrobium chrysotoxum]
MLNYHIEIVFKDNSSLDQPSLALASLTLWWRNEMTEEFDLKMKLNEEVVSKRFLLVLDDIQGEREKWYNSKGESMLAPLSCESLGSKNFGNNSKGLNCTDACKAIIGEIIKGTLGSPLAIKVIGGVLKDNLDERAFGDSSKKQFTWS